MEVVLAALAALQPCSLRRCARPAVLFWEAAAEGALALSSSLLAVCGRKASLRGPHSTRPSQCASTHRRRRLPSAACTLDKSMHHRSPQSWDRAIPILSCLRSTAGCALI
jgi:hypothetical protein